VRSLMERLTPDDGPLDKDLAYRFLRVVLRYIFKRSDTQVREALSYALHPATREVTMTWEEQLIQQGEQAGIEKGIEQGVRASKLDDARKMLDRGCDWEFITSITGIIPADLEG